MSAAVEKPSRFSSLHKRPRWESPQSLQQQQPPNLQIDPFMSEHCPVGFSSNSDIGASGSGGPPHLTAAQQTVLKPRKFFKSRGPMEVEIDFGLRASRPDVSSMMPQVTIK